MFVRGIGRQAGPSSRQQFRGIANRHCAFAKMYKQFDACAQDMVEKDDCDIGFVHNQVDDDNIDVEAIRERKIMMTFSYHTKKRRRCAARRA